MGLKAANSNFPCIECHCHKKRSSSYRCNLRKKEHKKQNEILRTARGDSDEDGENEADLTEANTSDLGYKYPPLMSIEYLSQLSDLLHMKNRITDVLFSCFINDLWELDSKITNSQIFNSEKHVNLDKFLVEVKTKCKININANGVAIIGIKNIFKSLTGNQRMLLLREITIKSIYEGVLTDASRIGWLWTTFYNIMNNLSTAKELIEPEDLKKRCQKWLRVFIDVYTPEDVTPYMHRFAMHLHEAYRLHDDLNLYNLQGFEKTNDILRQRYLRASNRRTNYIKQVLQKCLRISYLEISLNFEFVRRSN
jgi:hypothetical protein